MQNDFIKMVNQKKIIFDGAMGTMLMDSGLPPGEAPELFNIIRPDLIQSIHKKYFDAGADVVITNTFGANRVKLISRNLADKADTLNEAGARIAKEACPKGKWIAGDMGPTGKFLKPLGELSIEEMENTFFQQAKTLVQGGVDMLIIETMYSLDEALSALKGAKAAGDIPVIVSMTFNKTKRGFFSMMGEDVLRAVSALDSGGADILGANCSLGSRDMIDLSLQFRKATQKPVLIQPNAGKPIQQDGKTVYEQTPAEFAEDAKKIIDSGINMIGGCCGTTPEFIREISRLLS
jgi:5-methyltetrahydrofolate--homocysteine methyltransferase